MTPQPSEPISPVTEPRPRLLVRCMRVLTRPSPVRDLLVNLTVLGLLVAVAAALHWF